MDFSEIYKASEQKVYRFLLRMSQNAELAEELTEETFYQAFLHINQFEGRCSMDTWLCQIAKNLYYKEMKRCGRMADEQLVSNKTASTDNPFERLEDRQQALEIHKMLRTLPDTYREVFTLHVFAELTFKEIAQIFEKSESWAKMTYYRAKAALVNRLEEDNAQYE